MNMSDNITNMQKFVEQKELHEDIERERARLNRLVVEEYEENAVLTSLPLLEQSHVIDQLVLEQLKKSAPEK